MKKRKKVIQKLANINYINSQIYGVIAHDLFAPMSNLDTLLQITEKHILNNEIDQALRNINSSRSLLLSSNQLLEVLFDRFSFSEERKLVVEEFNFDEAIVQPIEEIYLSETARKNIIIIKENTDRIIISDKTLLSVVIRNLINNSIKFSHNNSKIIVRLTVDESQRLPVLIEVIDSGIGFGKGRREKVLKGEPIPAGSDTENKKSTALGFTLIRNLVGTLNGELNIVENNPNGIIVFVKIPNSVIKSQ